MRFPLQIFRFSRFRVDRFDVLASAVGFESSGDTRTTTTTTTRMLLGKENLDETAKGRIRSKMGKKNARHEMRMVEFAFAPPAP